MRIMQDITLFLEYVQSSPPVQSSPQNTIFLIDKHYFYNIHLTVSDQQLNILQKLLPLTNQFLQKPN